ncbi:MAG: hypothetical protein AB7U63_17250 [Porticoccaceae bacterium]
MTINLNGNDYTARGVEIGNGYVDGTMRQTLVIQLPADEADLSALNTLLSTPDALETILLTNPTGTGGAVSQVFNGFVIKTQLAVETVEMEMEPTTGLPQWEERIIIRLAQRTYLEQQVEDMKRLLVAAGLLNG